MAGSGTAPGGSMASHSLAVAARPFPNDTADPTAMGVAVPGIDRRGPRGIYRTV